MGRGAGWEAEGKNRRDGKLEFPGFLEKVHFPQYFKKKTLTQIVKFVMEDRKTLRSSCITRVLSEDFKDGKDRRLTNPTEWLEIFC